MPAGNRYDLPPFYALHAWVWRGNPSGILKRLEPEDRLQRRRRARYVAAGAFAPVAASRLDSPDGGRRALERRQRDLPARGARSRARVHRRRRRADRGGHRAHRASLRRVRRGRDRAARSHLGAGSRRCSRREAHRRASLVHADHNRNGRTADDGARRARGSPVRRAHDLPPARLAARPRQVGRQRSQPRRASGR